MDSQKDQNENKKCDFFKQLEEFMSSLSITPDEQKKFSEILLNLKKEQKEQRRFLVKINEEQQNFMAIAAHQLRTPLTLVNWYAEVLLNQSSICDTQSDNCDYTKKIYFASKRMTELVTSLLHITKLEIADPKKDNQLIKISDLLRSEISLQREKNIDKKLNIETSIEEIEIFSNNEWWGIVFNNLISNAIKYSPDEAKIEITLKKQQNDGQGLLVFSVKDYGLGIEEKDREQIFSRFFRGKEVQKKGIDGIGLGLYIVKLIIAKVGGEISFSSDPQNGTEFKVEVDINKLLY